MRPFERKIALITTAIDLIYTLDFLTEEQKAGIVTLTVKNDTKPCIVKIVNANRDKLIREQFLPDIEKLLSEEKSHEEICDEFIQLDPGFHVLVHHTGKFRPAFYTAKSSASPDPPGDPRTCPTSPPAWTAPIALTVRAWPCSSISAWCSATIFASSVKSWNTEREFADRIMPTAKAMVRKPLRYSAIRCFILPALMGLGPLV